MQLDIGPLEAIANVMGSGPNPLSARQIRDVFQDAFAESTRELCRKNSYWVASLAAQGLTPETAWPLSTDPVEWREAKKERDRLDLLKSRQQAGYSPEKIAELEAYDRKTEEEREAKINA